MRSQQLNNQNRKEEPEEVKGETSEFDLASLPKPELSGHAWIQRGTMLTCESCPFAHASAIPSDYQLYGIDDRGYPMLRKIDVKH